MAKAKQHNDATPRGSVRTKPAYFDPSNNWLEKAPTHRIIDLTDDQENKDADNTKIDKSNESKRPKGEGAKTKVAKAACDLATIEINGLYGEMVVHGRTTLQKAIAIGGKLVKIKATLKHGQFGDWIDTALDFDQKTAERYMKLYSERDKLKFDTMSKITSALRLLDEEKRAQRPKSSKPTIAVGIEAPVILPKPLHEIREPADALEKAASEDIGPGEVKILATAFNDVEAHEPPVFVASVPEEVLAELLDVTKRHEGKCQCQTIREDGQIKLNAYFTNRLGVKAA